MDKETIATSLPSTIVSFSPFPLPCILSSLSPLLYTLTSFSTLSLLLPFHQEQTKKGERYSSPEGFSFFLNIDQRMGTHSLFSSEGWEGSISAPKKREDMRTIDNWICAFSPPCSDDIDHKDKRALSATIT